MSQLMPTKKTLFHRLEERVDDVEPPQVGLFNCKPASVPKPMIKLRKRIKLCQEKRQKARP